MKTKIPTLLKHSALALSAVIGTNLALASGDYGPAIWNPPCNANYYTSGYGHKFHVCHDMEGYYLSTISYFKGCGFTGASVHYLTNGKQDTTSDAPAGEITQMISEANYAWHALCWNQHSTGTEHEGFASDPSWYTEAQYQASAGITAHICSKFGYAKDRNHVVAHGQKSVAGWPAWASANLGIDPYCNSHTDPGPYWDWTHYMDLVTGGGAVTIINDSPAASANWITSSYAGNRYGADYKYRSTAPVSDAAVFTSSLPSSGTYTVYVWYPEGANRSTATPYLISTSAGSHTEYVNQQITGGQWVNQGAYSMNSGNNTISVSCWAAAGYVVIADAVKWVK